MMSSPWDEVRSEVVVGKVLRRAEVSKMARKLQNRLALAQFKTNRGWEDLSLDIMEPRVEDEIRRGRPLSSGDMLSDSSSSSASDIPYTNARTLLSSPLKTTIFSDQIQSGGSRGHKKRFQPTSSPTAGSRKRHCPSPITGGSFDGGHKSWRDQLTQSSPTKPRKYFHFTTSHGPELSFYRGSAYTPNLQQSHDLPSTSDEDENRVPTYSFDIRASPPRTPPPTRPLDGSGRRPKDRITRSGEEGADLLIYLATSPSPAKPLSKNRMQTPSTPPPKNMALPSSMMNTPGGGGSGPLNVFGAPNTPSQGFDFADFVNITPSPAQNSWPKTPRTIKTPLTVARRRLTFDHFPPTTSSPTM